MAIEKEKYNVRVVVEMIEVGSDQEIEWYGGEVYGINLAMFQKEEDAIKFSDGIAKGVVEVVGTEDDKGNET